MPNWLNFLFNKNQNINDLKNKPERKLLINVYIHSSNTHLYRDKHRHCKN